MIPGKLCLSYYESDIGLNEIPVTKSDVFSKIIGEKQSLFFVWSFRESDCIYKKYLSDNNWDRMAM